MNATKIPFSIFSYAASFRKALVDLSELRWRRLVPANGILDLTVKGSNKTIRFTLTKTKSNAKCKVVYWEYTSETTSWKLAIFNQ